MGIFSNLNPLIIEEIAKYEKSYNKVIIKKGHRYAFKDNDGNIISKLDQYDYNVKNFDWVLMANVETKPEYRGQGLASKLINELCADVSKTNKGVYLLVRPDNKNAISLYKKLKFKTIKTYKLKDGEYIIMAKGNADTNQFTNMNFS